jgi:hypothetical protein
MLKMNISQKKAPGTEAKIKTALVILALLTIALEIIIYQILEFNRIRYAFYDAKSDWMPFIILAGGAINLVLAVIATSLGALLHSVFSSSILERTGLLSSSREQVAAAVTQAINNDVILTKILPAAFVRNPDVMELERLIELGEATPIRQPAEFANDFQQCICAWPTSFHVLMATPQSLDYYDEDETRKVWASVVADPKSHHARRLIIIPPDTWFSHRRQVESLIRFFRSISDLKVIQFDDLKEHMRLAKDFGIFCDTWWATVGYFTYTSLTMCDLFTKSPSLDIKIMKDYDYSNYLGRVKTSFEAAWADDRVDAASQRLLGILGPFDKDRNSQ